MMKINKKDLDNSIENIVLKYRALLSVIFAVVVVILYYFGIIRNVGDNLGNIGAFMSAILVVVSLVLTLLIYLNDKDNYKKSIAEFGTVKGKNVVFQYFYRIIIASVLCVFVVIAIGVLYLPYLALRLIVAFIGSFTFFYSIIGSVYMLYFSIDIVSNINKKTRQKMK